MPMTDIHVRAFIGPSLRTYLHSIAKLRVDVFRDYPFLEEAGSQPRNSGTEKVSDQQRIDRGPRL